MMRPIHVAQLDTPRPVLVLTRELIWPYVTSMTVAPLTRTARGLSTEVPVDERNGLDGPCVVSCDNIVTVPKAALGPQIGYLLPAQEVMLTSAVRSAFDLE